MIYLALIIPIITTAVFYFYKKHEFTWWEFFVPIVIVFIIISISKLIIDKTSVNFNEWWGSTITAVYEEEPYNYWDKETCSKSVPCGSHTDSNGNSVTDYCTIYYDCSHQDDVGPSWWAETNIGEKFNITESQHDQICTLFKTGREIIETHVNYDSDDNCAGSRGTKFEDKTVGKVSYVLQSKWDGNDEKRKSYSSQHSYTNKVKASDLTIFNIKLVDEKQADSLKLYKYPKLIDGIEYPTILGNVDKTIQEKFKRLNGKFGPQNELRLWILLFENQPMSIADYQENYWVKGNMNELVLCIGKTGDEIKWSKAFSWAHSAELITDVQSEVMSLYADSTNVPKLTASSWDSLYNYLDVNLHRFERRSFDEFDYITVEPSTGAKIFIYIFALIISVITNIIIIKNEMK